MTFTLDWNAIRPFDGGREKGFEELCSQLARSEAPDQSRFVRKGAPDAGVECYAVLSDGSEWAWQAKYFDVLTDTQWRQIDKSVRAAIEKHERLVRYFVCVPLDLSDARLPGQKSARAKWDEYVKKWTNLSLERGMATEFVYWGSHELLEQLAQPRHAGRVYFWFGVHGFDSVWFSERLDEALRTAGPRYTPEVHVDLPVALDFEAFGRTEEFFDKLKSKAREIRTELRTVSNGQPLNDEAVDDAVAAMSGEVQRLLTALGSIEASPIGAYPFNEIGDQVRASMEAAEKLARLLEEREREVDSEPAPAVASGSRHAYRANPFRDRKVLLRRLTRVLGSTRTALSHADQTVNSSLAILRGEAGTGKTHLLCDIARQRNDVGRPTVLLLGQKFVSNDEPWLQALSHLDLTELSAKQFVGALEAAAQAAGSRALLLVDALNEGAGRAVWPSHLEAFLAHVERSPWIGVVLSVRTSYEQLVVPPSVLERAYVVDHRGFAEHEYDAAKTFFTYYGLDLPSTPLLAPEFRNPLFLKTMCQGLRARGERRLPRGFHGISTLFHWYLKAVNDRLALALGFDARTGLVRRALEAVAEAMTQKGESWLVLSRADEVVNAFLPRRDFEGSLYRNLVSEGVLVEEAGRGGDGDAEVVVFVAYERLADHLMAKTLLDMHLDVSSPAASFAPSGALAFIFDRDQYVSPGLLEALCIQVPELTGLELPSFAPSRGDLWWVGRAFRQSLIWRSPTAFSDSTREALNGLSRTEHDFFETLEVLLTVATLPEHPLNAEFLDQRLRKDAMADRDAWWSVFLHQEWGNRRAVDRLVEWASILEPTALLDEDSVDLCAIALSWMLTTSNRFLRDRATKALVSLLTGRLPATVRLVDRFSDVDDAYVTERIYAVAYGVAMRSHDAADVAELAMCVYRHVFAAENPWPHILLRDYARGVVERALHLGATVDIVAERIRPPYKSTWPIIPTHEDIASFLPDWSKGSHDSGDLEWARNRIGSSVMSDDFTHYVIGTNSSVMSREWLSLRLDEPRWAPPPTPEEQLAALIEDLSPQEREALEDFESEDVGPLLLPLQFPPDWFVLDEQNEFSSSTDRRASGPGQQEPGLDEYDALMRKRELAVASLYARLSPATASRLKAVQGEAKGSDEAQEPRFDLRQVQRYILKRVFDLGWTTERFGYFDRFVIGYQGRSASKAERIGKKYQWIAYHEIMAHIADHFQYRHDYGADADVAYDGPWQTHLRDIDPSCTMRSVRGGTSWTGHSPAWWGAEKYEHWREPENPRDWVQRTDDLPRIEELLLTTNPRDRSKWLAGTGYFLWREPSPADLDPFEIERRELWYDCTGYLVKTADAQAFMEWAERADFWGRWMPEPAQLLEPFLGELSWAPASRYFENEFFGAGGWVQPRNDCPVRVRTVATEYLSEDSGFDCSVDETFRLRLPVSELVTGLGLRWVGSGADLLDGRGRLVAQDPTAHSDGPTALLFRDDAVREYLDREKLTICWSVIGEKRVLPPSYSRTAPQEILRMSGAFVLAEDGPTGFVKRTLNIYDGVSSTTKSLGVYRSEP